MGRLDGEVAFITGTGGGGTGRAAALRFAAEGARVAGCDINAETNAETAELVKQAGGEMLALHPVDLGDGDQVEGANRPPAGHAHVDDAVLRHDARGSCARTQQMAVDGVRGCSS